MFGAACICTFCILFAICLCAELGNAEAYGQPTYQAKIKTTVSTSDTFVHVTTPTSTINLALLTERIPTTRKPEENHQWKSRTSFQENRHHVSKQKYDVKIKSLPKIAVIGPDDASYESHMKVLATRVYPKTHRPTLCKNCNNFNFTPIIQPQNLCSDKYPIDLLVLVTTTPKARVNRQALRKTWMHHSKANASSVRHLFLLGGGWSEQEQSILYNESVRYKDILQEDYKDAYYNLSMKVISGYKWALEFCSQANFTLRTADDNFINIPGVVKWVRTKGHENMHAQIGYRLANNMVLRERKLKWFVTRKEFPHRTYFPYAIGTAFLYSMAAIKDVVKVAPNIPFFCLEDAWFGMLMREISMPVRNEPGFHKVLEGKLLLELLKGKCPNEGKFLSIHLVSPEAMKLLWQQCPSSN